MERFREHEKEFKMKQFSKRALLADFEKQSNFVDYKSYRRHCKAMGAGSGHNISSSYTGGSDYDSESYDSESDDSPIEQLEKEPSAEEEESAVEEDQEAQQSQVASSDEDAGRPMSEGNISMDYDLDS